jgi:hypothetical protein
MQLHVTVAQKNFYGKFATGNNETYLGVHAKYRYFRPILTNLGVSKYFHEVPNIKFQGHTFCGSSGDTCRQNDTQKPTGDFCDYANAPQNRSKTRGQDYANYLRAGHHSTVTATNVKTEC